MSHTYPPQEGKKDDGDDGRNDVVKGVDCDGFRAGRLTNAACDVVFSEREVDSGDLSRVHKHTHSLTTPPDYAVLRQHRQHEAEEVSGRAVPCHTLYRSLPLRPCQP